MKKLFIVVNVDWFFLSHRLPIAIEAIKRGWAVSVLAIEEESRGEEIRSYGINFVPLPSSRGGTNIFNDFKLLVFLYKLYKKEKPDIIHHVAIKPVLYGSIAARFAKCKNIVNAISGLGSNFTNTGFSFTSFLIKHLYKVALKNKDIKIIVQNKYDRETILSFNVDPKRVYVISGSGVDLNNFRYETESIKDQIIIVLIARMLKDKGIFEFVKAAEILKQKFKKNVSFFLAGKVDNENKTSIKTEQLQKWNAEGNVKWMGHINDVKELLVSSNIVVLPSYREGLPKSLIEACAIGRAIVTTDVPGCNEVVENLWNGLLIKKGSVVEMVEALEILIKDNVLRLEMGKRGRKLAEQKFSIENVINKTFHIYEQ